MSTHIIIFYRISQQIDEYDLELKRYQQVPLNLEYLSSGLYFVKINFANTSYNAKIIIE